MRLLKHIKLQGDLHPSYARIFAEYKFGNSLSVTLSPEFIFPVPEGAVITGASKMGSEKRLVKADVQPLSEAAFANAEMNLIRYSPQIYCLKWDSLEPNGECTILVELIMPLKTRNGAAELNIPLGICGTNLCNIYDEGCITEVNLGSSYRNLRAFSPTHKIETEIDTGMDMIEFSVKTTDNSDIILRFDGFDSINSFGVAGDGTGGRGIGLYRICTGSRQAYDNQRGRRIAVLVDIAPAADNKYAKELALRTIQSVPPQTKARVFIGEKALSADFVTIDDGFCEKFLYFLSQNDIESVTADKLINCSAELCEKNTDIIFVTADHKISIETRAALAVFPGNINVFTVGAQRADFDFYKELKGVAFFEHFYPIDLNSERVAEVLKRLAETSSEISITCNDCPSADIVFVSDSYMCSDGFADIAVRYPGYPFKAPRSFSVWADGIKIETVKPVVSFNGIDTYNTEVLHACAKIKNLVRLTNKLGVPSHARIKQEIEQLAVRYNIVTAETMLAVTTDEDRTYGIPVTFCRGNADAQSGSPQSIGIFREKGTENAPKGKNNAQLEEYCIQILKEAVRSDGAIAAACCTDVQERAHQTALSAAALNITIFSEREGEPEYAFDFVKNNPPHGLSGQLYAHRTSLAKFISEHYNEIVDMLPEYGELINMLKNRAQRVKAAAMLILQLSN